jgi:hypothetical protein
MTQDTMNSPTTEFKVCKLKSNDVLDWLIAIDVYILSA